MLQSGSDVRRFTGATVFRKVVVFADNDSAGRDHATDAIVKEWALVAKTANAGIGRALIGLWSRAAPG
jgi:hypothetical protein